MSGLAWAYLMGGEYRVVAEPTCTIEGGESWPSHPWTRTDPKLTAYWHCPRCGARRLAIPLGFALVPSRPAPEPRWAGFDEHGEPIPLDTGLH
jgi:hypothetical protein